MGNAQAKRKDVDPAFLRPAGPYAYTGCAPPPPAPTAASPRGPQASRRLTSFCARLGPRRPVRRRGGAHAAPDDPGASPGALLPRRGRSRSRRRREGGVSHLHALLPGRSQPFQLLRPGAVLRVLAADLPAREQASQVSARPKARRPTPAPRPSHTRQRHTRPNHTRPRHSARAHTRSCGRAPTLPPALPPAPAPQLPLLQGGQLFDHLPRPSRRPRARAEGGVCALARASSSLEPPSLTRLHTRALLGRPT